MVSEFDRDRLNYVKGICRNLSFSIKSKCPRSISYNFLKFLNINRRKDYSMQKTQQIWAKGQN